MMPAVVLRVPAVWLLLSAALLVPGRAHLYVEDDSLVSLEKGARSLLLNSSSCFLAQFFASWCGHCRHFKPVWLQLAQDVKDWRPVMHLGVLDCATESNSKTCNQFGVVGYPTLQFFNTFSKRPTDGIKYTGDRELEPLRHFIIDRLEAQKESPPPACPPLEPISAPEVDYFFKNNDETYLALIFEEHKKYMAREVALDLLQYEGISVRRVLEDQSELVERFKVSSFPSCFLLCRNGSISKIKLKEESRAAYKEFLRGLPGVKRAITNFIGWTSSSVDDTVVQRKVNSSVVYMADLESSIHYSLRVEMSRYSTFNGDRLRTVINYVAILKKFFPARPYLRNLLDSLHSWLDERRESVVLYKDFADVVNNKNQEQNAVLTPHVNFVGCQGSKPEFRGFPCSVWTLFHFMTVNAAKRGNGQAYPLEVLKVLRSYCRYFFGCRYCAAHFEEMAKESMKTVRTLDDNIRWLWSSHNKVNERLAGDASEDPDHPKVQWPPKELCPDCRIMVDNNVTWDEPAVLRFMKKFFSESNLSDQYLENESVLLENQKRGTGDVRIIREAVDEETEPEKQTVSDPIAPPGIAEEPADVSTVSKVKPSLHHRPTIIRMKSNAALQAAKEEEERIVDLDAPHYSPRRTLQDSNSKNRYVIQPERMLGLPDSEFDQDAVRVRLLKRGVNADALIGVVIENGDVNWKRHWVKMLEVGFSRLDIGICVILYFFTSMCLLVMYLYLSFRSRLRQRYLCLQP